MTSLFDWFISYAEKHFVNTAPGALNRVDHPKGASPGLALALPARFRLLDSSLFGRFVSYEEKCF
jgi:hypothetical protein